MPYGGAVSVRMCVCMCVVVFIIEFLAIFSVLSIVVDRWFVAAPVRWMYVANVYYIDFRLCVRVCVLNSYLMLCSRGERFVRS